MAIRTTIRRVSHKTESRQTRKLEQTWLEPKWLETRSVDELDRRVQAIEDDQPRQLDKEKEELRDSSF